MSSLGQLVIELAANTARLQSDLGKAVNIVDSAATKMKTAFKFAGGGLIGAFLVNTAKNAIEFGDNINKAAIKAGVGGKAFSELAYAAKLADVDVGALSTGIKKMQIALSEAATGGKQQTQALQALGITLADIQKRNPIAQFEMLADRISRLQDPADKARAATELFGKAGADLLPLFEQGAAGIAKARAEAEKLGISFGEDTLKKLADTDDSIKRMTASWGALSTKLTAFVAPAIASVSDALAGIDTRSIDDKIEDTQQALRRRFLPQNEQAKLKAQLDQLRGRRELEQVRALQTGTSGGPLGRRNNSSPIGYAAANAAAEASEAAKKAAAAALKEQEKAGENYRDMILDLNRSIDQDADRQLQDDMERQAQRLDMADEWYAAWVESEKKLAEFRDEQAHKLSEGAQIWKDAILSAWDDMVNTGKLKWGELLKYVIAEFARRGIAKLFDQMFTSAGQQSSGGAGFWSSILSVFAGGRATGGPVRAGESYVVGERGRELLTMGSSGYVTPNSALGGNAITFAPTYHITTRTDDPREIRRIMAENNRQTFDTLERVYNLKPA